MTVANTLRSQPLLLGGGGLQRQGSLLLTGELQMSGRLMKEATVFQQKGT